LASRIVCWLCGVRVERSTRPWLVVPGRARPSWGQTSSWRALDLSVGNGALHTSGTTGWLHCGMCMWLPREGGRGARSGRGGLHAFGRRVASQPTAPVPAQAAPPPLPSSPRPQCPHKHREAKHRVRAGRERWAGVDVIRGAVHQPGHEASVHPSHAMPVCRWHGAITAPHGRHAEAQHSTHLPIRASCLQAAMRPWTGSTARWAGRDSTDASLVAGHAQHPTSPAHSSYPAVSPSGTTRR